MDTQTGAGAPHSDGVSFTVRLAALADLPEVLRVQRAGFRRVAKDAGVPETRLAPLAEPLEQLRALHKAGVRTFIALVDERGEQRIVGTVRASIRADGVVEIGRLAVDDGFTRSGIATALMRALEDAFPTAARFELFTGADAAGPLALYERLGYHVFSRERMDTWSMVRLAKDRHSATAPARAPLD